MSVTGNAKNLCSLVQRKGRGYSQIQYLWIRCTSQIQYLWIGCTSQIQYLWIRCTSQIQYLWIRCTSQIQYHLPFFGQNIFPIESIFSISFEILKINPLYLTLHSSLKLFWAPNNLIIASIMDFSVVNYLAPWWIGLRVPSRWWGRAPCITQLALVWLWR